LVCEGDAVSKEDKSSSQPLSRADHEAIQALARAIVSEAGLGQNPKQDVSVARRGDMIQAGRRSHDNAIDFCKHLTTLNTATIAGVTAFAGASVRDFEPILLYMSLGFFAASLAVTGGYYWILSINISPAWINGEVWEWNIKKLGKESQGGSKIRRRVTVFQIIAWYMGVLFGVVSFVL
jgi:hypothetical protein